MKDNKKEQTYSYYSRILKEPFDTIEELNLAEEAYYVQIKAKEDKAAAKKADALKVEEAFKALNAARKAYKEDMTSIVDAYTEALKELKEDFAADKAEIEETLAEAEEAYKAALKEFNDKHPEGYHLTLRDGDFETTVSGGRTTTTDKTATKCQKSLFDIFDSLFNF
jgi:predicted phage tail protein